MRVHWGRVVLPPSKDMRGNLFGRAFGYVGLARHARNLRRDRDAVVRANARLHIVNRMGKLRGLPQKFGQMVSMRGDQEAAPVYERLTDSAKPLPWKQIKKVLERVWGGPIEKKVRWMDHEGLAASLGQVHRATLHDGRDVAVKVRYPGISKAVVNDLKVLGLIAGQGFGLPGGMDLAHFRAQILRNLDEELDYRKEAEHQRRYRALTADSPEWIIPEVVDELSNDEVLVSVWETGERIGDAAGWPAAYRQRIADTLLDGLLRMMFRHGLVHADPHPGNYRFTWSGDGVTIILYDFGSVADVTHDHRMALLKLLDIAANKRGDPYKAFVALGFSESALEPIRGKLPGLCGALFQPLYSPGRYKLEWGRIADGAAAAAGNDVLSLWLNLPAHLLFVMRALNGLRFYHGRLQADVSWSEALSSHVAHHQTDLARL